MNSNNNTKLCQDKDGQLLMEFYNDNLPKNPYATDFLGSLSILSKNLASEKAYIQHNNVYSVSWLVMDVDQPDSLVSILDKKFPPPNISVTNKNNGHSHLFYAIRNKIYRYNAENQKPIKFASAVEYALTKATGADENYSGFISKNPKHDSWFSMIWYPTPWNLQELADKLDLSEKAVKLKPEKIIGLGRNCELFDTVRKIAYTLVRDSVNYPDEKSFFSKIQEVSAVKNSQLFAVPLMGAEVKGLAKSVAKWTWRNMSAEGFLEWADSRREKSLSKRQAKMQDLQNKIYEMRKHDWYISTRAMAENLGVSKSTVDRLLRELKENKADRQTELFLWGNEKKRYIE